MQIIPVLISLMTSEIAVFPRNFHSVAWQSKRVVNSGAVAEQGHPQELLGEKGREAGWIPKV